jgi:serine/threonine protein kinase
MNHRHLLKGIGLKSAWAFEIARGMAFLHAQNPPILHRDLKCANILLSGDLNAKITDFGESRTLSGVDENSMTTVGTPYFMAPEVFSSEDVDRTYSTKVDIYSFGVMLFEIYNNCELKKAFQNKGGMIIMNRVSKGWRPNLKAVKEEDKELADVIERCWSQDFSKRPTFEELIAIFQAQGGQDD